MSMTRIIALVFLIVAGVGGYFYIQRDAGEQAAPAEPEAPAAMEISFGNNSWDALASIELSPAGQGTYQAIPLTDGKLGAGEFYSHGIPDGQTVCTYDLRVTKENGDVSERAGVDLCAATYYHFEDDS